MPTVKAYIHKSLHDEAKKAAAELSEINRNGKRITFSQIVRAALTEYLPEIRDMKYKDIEYWKSFDEVIREYDNGNK